MSDSVIRLRVDSAEYDNKLKQAAQGLTRYAELCRKVGGTLEKVETDTLDFVKALGRMETKSSTTTGKLSEMKKAFMELSMQYKSLTDAERNSPYGKALESSLNQLKMRIRETQGKMKDISSDINGGLTDSLDSLAGKFGLNIKQLTGMGAALTAATGALKVAKDAYFNNEQQLDDWNRSVESAESVYKGFLSALNNGDVSGFLANINNIVTAAAAAYDALDELGTFNAFNSINLEGAQADFAQSLADFRTGKASKDDVVSNSEKLKKELRDRQKKEWDAYIAAVTSAAAERGANANDVINALGGTYQDWSNLKHSNVQGSGTRERYNPLTRSYDTIHFAATPGEKLSEFARQINDTQLKELQEMGAQAMRTARELASVDRQMARVLGAGGKTTKKETITYPEESVGELTKEMQEFVKLQQYATNPVQWEEYANKIKEVSYKIKEIKGDLGLKEVKPASLFTSADSKALAESEAKRQEHLKTMRLPVLKLDKNKEKEVSAAEEIGKMSAGVSQMVTGLQQLGVDLPEGISEMVGGIQTVISIISGISSILVGIEALTAADAIIPFAEGGVVRAATGTVVPGHSFSGDRVPALLNSGEVVFNRSQVGNLEALLESPRLDNLHLETYLDGQAIKVVLNNNNSARGYGKFTSTRVRGRNE